jgi:hypothetical protein
MQQYFCYFLQQNGRPIGWRAFAGESDEAARDVALGLLFGFPDAEKVEVTNRDRLIFQHSRSSVLTTVEMRRLCYLAIDIAQRERDPQVRRSIAAQAARLAQKAEALEREGKTCGRL